MLQESINRQNILITGGTSGLGIELVKLFLKKGNAVIALGRQMVEFPEYGNTFKLFQVDFSDLNQVAVITRTISEGYDINVIINNAGILSPPDYKSTIDGLEYTFQVNFLSHLLINEIIIGRKKDCGHLTIANVTSPVYRMPGTEMMVQSGESGYNPVKAYSSSKLCLTQICKFLDNSRAEFNLVCFSYDPGTFSSGIFRMQKRWFRTLYNIASPFMRSPLKVAKVLSEIITEDEIENGMIYNVRKRTRLNPEIDEDKRKAFKKACYELIDPLISSDGEESADF
jgi:NAD(P)-dependent dehydrogenase (short-subunit alcohol dehydrogenase family)